MPVPGRGTPFPPDSTIIRPVPGRVLKIQLPPALAGG